MGQILLEDFEEGRLLTHGLGISLFNQATHGNQSVTPDGDQWVTDLLHGLLQFCLLLVFSPLLCLCAGSLWLVFIGQLLN